MNQNPKQFTRDTTDADHLRCGQTIQANDQFNLNTAAFVAVRKYQIDIDPADDALFAASKLLCLINCKGLKETMLTVGFSISKILYLQKPSKIKR